MKEFTKRSFSRNHYEAPIRFASYDELKYTDAKMYNSSMGGMYFEADHAVLPESDIQIKMKKYMPKTHGPEAFKAYKAKVKWCNKIDKADASCFGIGVQYIVKSHVDREVNLRETKYFCAWCDIRISYGQIHEIDDFVYLCSNCFKHMKELPNGETKKNIVDILLGNVI